MIKLGTCDCETLQCERNEAHEAGNCPSEAVVKVQYGENGYTQNLCEDCLPIAASYAGRQKIALIVREDLRRKPNGE